MTGGRVRGLLLAAGAGRRMGRPKALVPGWLPSAVAVLREGGCAGVTVVLGAAADQARPLVPEETEVVVADDWAEGMGASLAAGLEAVAGLPEPPEGVVVHLVDLPDVPAAAVARLLAAATGRAALARAAYAGVPGHPVLLGADHWSGVRATAAGDQGARAYLREHAVALVECGDLATGRDVDTPG